MISHRGSVGIFGGTFNPIHLGHLLVAQEVREKYGLKQVVFIPVYLPPHKSAKGVIEPKHRLNMIKKAIQGNPYFKVSNVEIARKGKSYTFDTIQFFRRRLGKGAPLFFITGSDALNTLHHWYKIEQLLALCQFIIVPRPGHPMPPAKRFLAQRLFSKKMLERIHYTKLKVVDISSSEIRRMVRDKRDVSYLVSKPIADYMKSHQLYKN